MNAIRGYVSVIIRARDEARHIGEALTAIRAQAYEPGCEVLVVDCESRDGTAAVARQHGASVVSIARSQFTFGRALNLAASQARGDYLVPLSADATPQGPDFLARLVAPLADVRVAATYSRQVPRPDCCPSEARDLAEWYPATPRPLPRPFLSNAGAALRRAIWQAYPFPEDVAGAEDAVWAAMIMAAGYEIVYVPAAVVVHSHSPSPRVAWLRGRREAGGLRQVDPGFRRFGLARALRMAGGLAARDWRYAVGHGYGVGWWPHLLLYRLAQAFGIYQGLRRS